MKQLSFSCTSSGEPEVGVEYLVVAATVDLEEKITLLHVTTR